MAGALLGAGVFFALNPTLLKPEPPRPLTLHPVLPKAQHAGSLPVLDLLSYRPTDDDRVQERLCAHLEEDPTDEREIAWLQERDAAGWRVLEVRGTDLRLDGAVVLTMSDAAVHERHLSGQLILPLYDQLLELAEGEKAVGEMCRVERRWYELLLAVEPGVPWSTLRQVMYTAGQAQFGGFHLAVDDETAEGPEASGRWQGLVTSKTERFLTVGLRPGELKVQAVDGLTATGSDLTRLSEEVLLDAPGCALLIPDSDTSTRQVAQSTDILLGLRASSSLARRSPGVTVAESNPSSSKRHSTVRSCTQAAQASGPSTWAWSTRPSSTWTWMPSVPSAW